MCLLLPPPPLPPKKIKHVLTDRLLQCALYRQEMGILNNTETDSIHALFFHCKDVLFHVLVKNNV